MTYDATTLLLYCCVFLIPVVILICSSLFILTRGLHSFANWLITFILCCYISTFLAIFIAHSYPTLSPYLTNYVHAPAGILSLGALIHLAYWLIRNLRQIHIPLAPYIFYVPALAVFIGAFFADLPFAQFHKNNIWIHTSTTTFLTDVYNLSGILLVSLLCFVIYIALKIRRGIQKKMFYYFSTVLVISISAFYIVEWLLPDNLFFPFFSMYIQVSCILAIGAGMVHLELSPSIANRYRELIAVSPIGIVILDHEFRIVDINDNARKPIVQYGVENVIHALFFNDSSLEKNGSVYDLLTKQRILTNHVMRMKDSLSDNVYFLSINASILEEEHQLFYYLSFFDMTEEMIHQQQLQQLAFEDQLTKLPNRAYFIPKVTQLVTDLQQGTLILIDLNSFKQINDTYGHKIGDYVLQHTAQILRNEIQSNDEMARLGGDEFVIYLPNSDEAHAMRFVDSLRERFVSTPFIYEQLSLIISPSIGYSIIHATISTHFEYYYQLADDAMYLDKQRIKKAREL